eukprot:750175-Hanusia_phi.AAC.1
MAPPPTPPHPPLHCHDLSDRRSDIAHMCGPVWVIVGMRVLSKKERRKKELGKKEKEGKGREKQEKNRTEKERKGKARNGAKGKKGNFDHAFLASSFSSCARVIVICY